jgi:type IV secretion system protein VirB10
VAQGAGSNEKILVPAGTRIGVVLENGISTRSAKPGDSVYLQTSFPITQNNRIVIPVGSYLRGEIIDSKRPGKVKGKGEFRLRLNTLILPNGYTVNLNAAPRSADSGGKETMDSEGKVTGPSDKGKDAGTIVSTTATGAGIGAIASRSAKGAGIGGGIGAAAGLAAVLLSRGPEAELPRDGHRSRARTEPRRQPDSVHEPRPGAGGGPTADASAAVGAVLDAD